MNGSDNMKYRTLKKNKWGMKFILLISILVVSTFLLYRIKFYDIDREIIKKENYYMKIDYPKLENDRKNSRIVNSIKKYITSKKDEFIDTVRNLERDDIIYDFLVSNSMNEYEDLISIHILINSYTGGAHYTREDKSYHYRKETGEEISLSNLLEDEDALEKLSYKAYTHILKYKNDNNLDFIDEIIREGTEAKYENFTHFTFEYDGLNILFPPYQVASWADGEVRITIPYNELRGIINEEYLKIFI